MRRFLFLLAPAAFAAFSFACEDDPSGAPGVNFPEAGSFDANRDPSDSGPNPGNDAQPDSPVGPKGVTVVVTGRLGPKSGYTVVFHDAAGAVLETKATGADGKATSTPTNATKMATVDLGGQFNRQLLTWTGVEDGDELPAVVTESGSFATASVTLPNEVDAGQGLPTYYARIGGCGSFGTNISNEPITFELYDQCLRGGGGALLVEARDPNDTDVLGFTFKKPTTLLTDGGTMDFTGLPAFAAPATIKVQATGPANIMEGSYVRLSEIANNTALPSHESGYLGNSGNGTTYEGDFQIAPATFTEAVNVAIGYFPTTPSNELIIGKRAAPTGTITLDANALPPAITASSYDQANKKRPIAKWTGGTTGMKGGLIRMRWFNNPAEKETTWTIVVPATGTEVTAPALPASLDSALPDADAGMEWENEPEVIFADSSLLLGGYATFRKVQGAIVPSLDSDAQVHDTVLPANGDFKITRWFLNNVR